MAHPHASSRADKVGKSRASSFMKDYKQGGAIKALATGGAATPAKKKSGGEVKVQGLATGGRLDKFARGGRAKKHGTQVNIAVVNPSKGGPPSSPGGPPAGGGLPAPGGPLSMMPPKGPPPGLGGPPGGPPGMPPPGMKPPGMMRRGGAVKAFAKGGKVTGQKGGDNGVGRLDKKKMYGLKPIKGKDE